MARATLLLVVPLLLVGCTPQERDDAIAQGARVGKEAAGRVADAATRAWKAASEQASKLTPDSAAAALENAKDSMEHAVAELKPGERLDAARAEIDRLRAALDLQKLRKEADEKIAEAQQVKENAGKSIEDVKAKLDAADQAYQDLKARLDSAEQAYDAAAKKADEAKQAVSRLAGGA